MRTALAAVLFLTLLGLGHPQAPHPPEPRPGWSCSPMGTGDKRCRCKRVDDSPSCEGTPTPDPTCKSWCWESQHCACPVMCAVDHKGE